MDFAISTDMPRVLKWMTWVAAGLVALGTIWAYLKKMERAGTAKFVRLIWYEMLPNGGGSLKDLMVATAKDSKDALEITKELVKQVGALRKEVDQLKSKQARHIVHEANNDLADSSLVVEERRLLDEIDRHPSQADESEL